MFELRMAVDADVESLVELFEDMHAESDYAKYPPNIAKTRAIIGRWVSEAWVLLAVDGEEIVGAIIGTCYPSIWSDDNVVSEQFLFVRKPYRHTGVAGQLVDSFMTWAKSVSNHIHAGVSSGVGGAAEALYEKAGMYTTGRNYAWHASSNA